MLLGWEGWSGCGGEGSSGVLERFLSGMDWGVEPRGGVLFSEDI